MCAHEQNTSKMHRAQRRVCRCNADTLISSSTTIVVRNAVCTYMEHRKSRASGYLELDSQVFRARIFVCTLADGLSSKFDYFIKHVQIICPRFNEMDIITIIILSHLHFLQVDV